MLKMNRTFGLKPSRYLETLLLALLLSGCGSNKWFDVEKEPLKGERIPVLDQTTLTTVKSSGPINLSVPHTNDQWAQAGGNAEHAAGHLTLSAKPEKTWKYDIGSGASQYLPMISGPIAAEGTVFAMDTQGTIVATLLDNGKKIWEASLQGVDEGEEDTVGGGLAYSNGFIYASSPFAELVCFEAKTGKETWRKSLYNPSRVAPTVRDGRVYVLTIANELHAFNATTGETLWTHSGIVETAEVLGGASPAVQEGVVVVAYSSGEIFALKAENGQELWSEGLVPHFHTDSISALAHIRAHPVIAGQTVYAVSQSGKSTAINLNTGQQLWQKPLGGLHMPAVEGNYLFMVTMDDELACLNRQTGDVLWIQPLGGHLKEGEDPILWSGPILAGGHAILTGSNGDILFFSPEGELVHTLHDKSGIPVPPIVVESTLVTINHKAEITAYR